MRLSKLQTMRILVLAVLTTASLHCFAQDAVRLGYSDVENFPYQMGNGDQIAAAPGVAVELIRAAADEAGVKVVFVRMPAPRLLLEMQAGRLDGAFIFSYKDERQQSGVYPMQQGKPDRQRRITSNNYSFYKLAGSDVAWDGVKLSNWRAPIGINFSFSIGDDLKKMQLTVDDGGRGTEQNFDKLRLGRISAYATLEDSGDAFLRRKNVTQVVKLEPPIVVRDYYLMLSHQYVESHKTKAELLWTRLGEVRAKRSASLFEKYAD